jgi:hypothetical protein
MTWLVVGLTVWLGLLLLVLALCAAAAAGDAGLDERLAAPARPLGHASRFHARAADSGEPDRLGRLARSGAVDRPRK